MGRVLANAARHKSEGTENAARRPRRTWEFQGWGSSGLPLSTPPPPRPGPTPRSARRRCPAPSASWPPRVQAAAPCPAPGARPACKRPRPGLEPRSRHGEGSGGSVGGMRLQAERKPMTQVTGRARASRVGTLTASQHSETSPLLPDLRIPPGLRASGPPPGAGGPRSPAQSEHSPPPPSRTSPLYRDCASPCERELPFASQDAVAPDLRSPCHLGYVTRLGCPQ